MLVTARSGVTASVSNEESGHRGDDLSSLLSHDLLTIVDILLNEGIREVLGAVEMDGITGEASEHSVGIESDVEDSDTTSKRGRDCVEVLITFGIGKVERVRVIAAETRRASTRSNHGFSVVGRDDNVNEGRETVAVDESALIFKSRLLGEENNDLFRSEILSDGSGSVTCSVDGDTRRKLGQRGSLQIDDGTDRDVHAADGEGFRLENGREASTSRASVQVIAQRCGSIVGIIRSGVVAVDEGLEHGTTAVKFAGTNTGGVVAQVLHVGDRHG